MNFTCPRNEDQRCYNLSDLFCGNKSATNCVSYNIGTAPSYVALVSSSLSCFGSILIVLAFILFRDIRGGMAQKIITALAIADFVSAAGYIAGSTNYLVFFNQVNSSQCAVFDTICRVQAFVTSWSSMSSFAWTSILAVYFYLLLVFQKRSAFHSVYQQVFIHIIAWLSPLLIVAPFTGLQLLGYAPYAASNWCFVAQDSPLYSSYTNSHYEELAYNSLVVLAAGKFWEVLTYFIVIVIYSHIILILEKLRRHNYRVVTTPGGSRVERKMIYIPLIFLLLRLWGTIQFIINIIMQVQYPNNNGCILKGFWYTYFVLGILQAIGDPGQGWGNAFLYVLLSDNIRKRMITDPLKKCIRFIGQRIIKWAMSSSNDDDSNTQEQDQMPHNREDDGAIDPTTSLLPSPGANAQARYGTSPVREQHNIVESINT